MSDTPDAVERALSLLVHAARVSPPLRDAVATVENEIERLRLTEEELRIERAENERLRRTGDVQRRDPHHYVTFDDRGWVIEHSLACRAAGTLGTCAHNDAIREIADEPDPEMFGRWRITDIDSEGLPSLERAPELRVVVEPTREDKP